MARYTQDSRERVRDAVDFEELVGARVELRRAGDIVQGDEVGGAMTRLRSFMFEHVYLGPLARAEHAKIERVLRGLFDWYCSHPDELPEGESLAERVIDWLAGMTDRYAIRAWSERFVPQGLAV